MARYGQEAEILDDGRTIFVSLDDEIAPSPWNCHDCHTRLCAFLSASSGSVSMPHTLRCVTVDLAVAALAPASCDLLTGITPCLKGRLT